MEECFSECLIENNIGAKIEYYLQNCDLEMILLHENQYNRNEILDTLRLFYKNENIIKNSSSEAYTLLFWIIKSFLSRNGFQDQALNTSMLLLTFKKYNPSFYHLIYRSLVDKSFVKLKGQDLSVTFQLFNLLFSNQGLLHSVLPFISNLLSMVPIDQMFSQYGFGALLFYEIPPYEFLIKGTYKVLSFISCFSLPTIYQFTRVAQIFQIRFASNFLFPKEFPECGDDGKTLSLVHTSILKEMNSIDFAYKLFLEGIKDNDKIKITSIVDTLSDIFPWFAIGSIKLIGGDIEKVKIIDKAIKQSNIYSIASDMLHRILSDLKLLTMAINLQKRKLNYSDLSKYSIPYLLNNNILSPYVLKLLDKSFFMISDDAKIIDFDFIHGYLAISGVLELLPARIDDPNGYDDSLSRIEEHIKSIINEETKQSIVMMIFSSLFIQSKGSFVCLLVLAKKILNLLIRFSPPKEVEELLIATKCAVNQSGMYNISSALTDRKSIFIQQIGEKKFENAKLIAENNEDLMKLYVTAYKVHCNSINADWEVILDENASQIVDMETSFSTNCNYDTYTSKGEVEMLRNIRSSTQGNPLAIFHGHKVGKSMLDSFNQLNEIIDQCGLHDESLGKIFTEITKRDNACEISEHVVNYGFDIFGFWMSHLDLIRISPKLLCHFIEKNPIECLAIALVHDQNLISCINPEKYGTVLEKYIKKVHEKDDFVVLMENQDFDKALNLINCIEQDSTKQELLFRLLKTILCCHSFNPSILDDIIYQLDQNQLYELCSNEYNTFRIRAASELVKYELIPANIKFYITLFNLTSVGEFENPLLGDYVSSSDFVTSLQTIGPKVSFASLVSMLDDDMINASLEYISYNLIKTSDDLSLLFQKFPGKLSDVFTYLRGESSYLDVFLRHCPGKYRQLFGSLMNISEISKTDKHFDFSVQSIQQAIKRTLYEYHGVGMIKSLYPKFIDLCTRFPESKKLFNDSIQDIIAREIASIKVASIADEMMAKRLLVLLNKFPMNDSEKERIESIGEIINIGIYQRFNMSYSFDDYPSEIFVKRVSNMLFKNEFDQEAIQLCTTFNVSFEEHAAQRLDITFFLGVGDASRFWAQFTTITKVEVLSNLAFGLGVTDVLVQDILKSNISKIQTPSFNFIQRIKYLAEKRPQQSAKRQNDLQSFVSYFVRPTSRAVNVLCSYGFIEPALNLFFSLPLTEESIQAFIHDVIFPIISHSLINELFLSVYQLDPGLSFVLQYFLSLVGFFRERKMYFCLLSFLISMNWIEDAAVAATQCFNESSNYTIKLRMLYNAEQLIRQTLAIRQGISIPEQTFPYRPSDLSEKEILQLADEIRLQMKLFDFYKDTSSEDLKEVISKLITEETAEYAAIRLGLSGNFKYIEEICNLYHFNLRDILRKIFCKLARLKFDEIKPLMENIITQVNPSDFVQIYIREFLNCLAMSETNWYAIPAFIIALVADGEMQSKLCIDYGFLNEAIDFAIQHKNKKMLALIAALASSRGEQALVSYAVDKIK